MAEKLDLAKMRILNECDINTKKLLFSL